jgi:hypothetical protein
MLMHTPSSQQFVWRAPTPGLRWKLTGAIVAMVALMAAAGPASTTPPEFREHDIKAVFLFRFLQFVEWPATAFAEDDSPIVIGVLGDDPFGAALDETVRNEVVGNRHVVIRRGTDLAAVQPCHLLFVSRQPDGTLPDTWSPLPTGVLLVGEAPEFLSRGGMVNFYMQDNQVRFEICPEAVEQAQLRMRSRLLRLARLVECPAAAPH